ncbi:hypothetical protein HMPREF2710_06420 [Rothia sp. HMSC069D01]|nr:hypothetical protein HMPREF2710_06420 [Rothia sp. HMSC069D01]OFR62478.1 hypothetical protein HMPREF2879_08305 [Rothia sp. HMSC069C04]
MAEGAFQQQGVISLLTIMLIQCLGDHHAVFVGPGSLLNTIRYRDESTRSIITILHSVCLRLIFCTFKSADSNLRRSVTFHMSNKRTYRCTTSSQLMGTGTLYLVLHGNMLNRIEFPHGISVICTRRS